MKISSKSSHSLDCLEIVVPDVVPTSSESVVMIVDPCVVVVIKSSISVDKSILSSDCIMEMVTAGVVVTSLSVVMAVSVVVPAAGACVVDKIVRATSSKDKSTSLESARIELRIVVTAGVCDVRFNRFIVITLRPVICNLFCFLDAVLPRFNAGAGLT